MIRIAKPEEIGALIEIIRITFEKVSIDKSIEDHFGRLTGTPWINRKAVDIRRDLAQNPQGVFVKIVDNKIAGFITTVIDSEFSTGRIPHLAVLPEYQGKGIGKELLRHALQYIKDSGMKLMRIEVLAHNKGALKLYREFGFEEVSTQLHLAMPVSKYDTLRPEGRSFSF